jgi:RHS repeat-associated protein
MTLVDRVNRQRSLTAMSRTLRSGRIAANASVPTTTYTYDANGNVTQAGGWSYVWDYLNRMLASGYNNSTTTYAYDQSGARVLQVSTTSTTYYPSKYFSLASTTSGGASWATSTNYIWLGDTLLATIDQKLYNSAATGSPITRYVHPDHLGSTNVVTDASGSVVQLLDYYPYGAMRVSSSTYPTNEKRQYIGQYADAQTNLSYLNARFYDGQRGQFLSEDPVTLAVGDPSLLKQYTGKETQAYLNDPQALNIYNYVQDNPLTLKDPSGLTYLQIGYTQAKGSIFSSGGIRFDQYGIDYFGGAGTGLGVEKGIDAAVSSGDLSHEPEVSSEYSATYAEGWGGTVSITSSKTPYCSTCKAKVSPEVGLVLGGGASAGVVAEYSHPIIKWGSPPPDADTLAYESSFSYLSSQHATISAYHPQLSSATQQTTHQNPNYGGLSQTTLSSLAAALKTLSKIITQR